MTTADLVVTNGRIATLDERLWEECKLADFAILKDDPWRMPAENLRDMEVAATYVGGDPVREP